MTRVSGQVVYPNTATPVAGAHVEIRAIGSTTDPSAPAYVPAASAEIFSPYKTSADDFGHWHADLIPSDELVPVGCLYSVLYRWDGDTHVFYIDVPSGGEVWVGDIQVAAGDELTALRIRDLAGVTITDPAVGEVLGIIDVIDGVEVWGNVAQTGGGGGGSALTVKSNGVVVDAAVTTLDYSSQFSSTESPNHEINFAIVSLAASVIDSGTLDAARIPDLSGTYQLHDADLDAIALLTTTAYGRSFLTLADAAAAIALLGLSTPFTVPQGGTGAATFTTNGVLYGAGTSAIVASAAGAANQVLRIPSGGGSPTFGPVNLASSSAVVNALAIANGGTGAITAPLARTALGLAIGTDVQAFDSDLAAIAALTTTAYGRDFLTLADASAALAYVGTYSSSAIDSLIAAAAAGAGKRGRVRAATTAPITISTALNNGDTLDGVSLVTADLVLVKDQAAPAENGIYVVGAVPARSTDFDTWTEYPGSLISVAEGTANADGLWICTSNEGGTLGVTAITFARTVITGELLAANNLSDVLSAATSRSNLGLAIGSQVQAWDADLDALAALGSTGLAARTAANTWAQRSIAVSSPSGGIAVANGDGVAANPTLSLDADLEALAALAATGIVARTGAATYTPRTITAGASIGVTDGSGVSGNPTIAVTDAELAAIAGLTSAADQVPYFSGSGTAALFTAGTVGRAYAGLVRNVWTTGVDIVIPAGTRVFALTSALTVSRNCFLPLANTYTAGTTVTIVDEVGSSSSFAIVVQPSGSDVIHPISIGTVFVMGQAYGSITFISDGTSKWTAQANTFPLHGSLQALVADDHLQYANINALRSAASQTFEYGSASGATIIERTTSHATKGRFKRTSGTDFGNFAESFPGAAPVTVLGSFSGSVPFYEALATDISAITGRALFFVGGVTTSNATITNAISIDAEAIHTPDCTWQVQANVVAFNDTDNLGSSYVRIATFRNVAGTVALIGAVQTLGTDQEEAGGTDATIDTSANAIRVRVTGTAAKTVRWMAWVQAVISGNLS